MRLNDGKEFMPDVAQHKGFGGVSGHHRFNKKSKRNYDQIPIFDKGPNFDVLYGGAPAIYGAGSIRYSSDPGGGRSMA